MKIHFLRIAALMLCLFSALRVQANEPIWTDAERAAHSDAVLTGVVQSVRKERDLNERENLFSAVVQVKEVQKQHDSLDTTEVTLYFKYPKNGKATARCPAYVELTEKQSATFYIRIRQIGTEKLQFLDMGSDVRAMK